MFCLDFPLLSFYEILFWLVMQYQKGHVCVLINIQNLKYLNIYGSCSSLWTPMVVAVLVMGMIPEKRSYAIIKTKPKGRSFGTQFYAY